MITTVDIYDICSLYFVQAVARFDHLSFVASCTGTGNELLNRYAIRCYMYVLAGAMVIGGEYT